MSGSHSLPREFHNLLDEYCSDLLDEPGLRRLEAYLLENEDAQREFVLYFQMHTDLEFTVRAQHAASAALEQVDHVSTAAPTRGERADSQARRTPSLVAASVSRWALVAAGFFIAVMGFAFGNIVRWHGKGSPAPLVAVRPPSANVAWLVNAQNCRWDDSHSEKPGRDMQAGKVLRLRHGLAEIEFDRGARLILQGPAGLELISGNAAKLLYGALTARVPDQARGFTVFSPHGRVVDLGTEFGLAIDKNGGTAVRVFKGMVIASPNQTVTESLTLHANQSARIDDRTVALKAAADDPGYVRSIVPPPVVTPRTRALDFARPTSGTLLDGEGVGTGLTHRLPGTGISLPERDTNLRLNATASELKLTTTRSDINTQVGMDSGEYLGFRLKDMGFTGDEDFAVSATIPKIPGLERVGQFGLYAGTRSDRNIRGGLISQPEPDRYLLFLVNNKDGIDSDLYEVGLTSSGDDMRLTLRRVAGAYSLVVENLTRKSSSTLSIAHPMFLNGERDLYVGFFGANTQSDLRKTLTIKDFGVKVWTVTPPKEPPAAEPEKPGHAEAD
jgi:hypothetical protein